MARPNLPPRFADRAELRAHRDGMTLEDVPGGYLLAVVPGDDEAEDPHFRIRPTRAIGIYEAGAGGSLHLRGSVRHAPRSAENAMRSARLLARLMRLHESRFGTPIRLPRDADRFDAWLVDRPAADASVGGETRTNHIYVWDADSNRTSFEWARTLCHEFGHLVLSAARGYAAPEGDAAGYLGEALFVEFLKADDAPVPQDDHCRPSDLERYAVERNLPRERKFLAVGPADRTLDRLDGSGMDLYIGGALAVRRAYGPGLLWKAMRGIDDESPRELFASLRRTLLGQRETIVRLPAWVPFYADQYQFAAREGTGILRISSLPPVAMDSPRSVRFPTPGWRLLASDAGNLATIALRRGPK
ncbi:MAG: hypothetical protein ACKO5K_12400 [Armatimonadota bacterium]